MAFDHQQYNRQYVANAQAGNPPINNADAYDVRLVPARNLPEGTLYWKIIGIHHLLPEENIGNHHVYLEALDETGNRVRNPHAWAGWTWEGKRPDERADPIALDKPDYETAGNVAMHFGQKISAWLNGLSPAGADPSDTAENMHTSHPDEPGPDGQLWNSIGHHSFYVVFQRARKSGVITQGIIRGAVLRGEGRAVQLQKGGLIVAEQLLDQSEAFEFKDLTVGTYRLAVIGTEVTAENLAITLTNPIITLQLELPVIDNSVIFGAVENGIGRVLQLLKDGAVVDDKVIPPSTNYRFEGLSAGVYTLHVLNTGVRQENIQLDGSNSREINLVVPQTPDPNEKFIPHYLLLGPPGSAGRRVNFQLLGDFALAFSVTVGFSALEAQSARNVTIIGGGISQATQDEIRQSGSKLELLAGDAYAIEAELRRRIETGNAFPGG